MVQTLLEPARQIPVIAEADVCVLGGSCTGVFAALAAARRGLKVVIVEKQNCFGGVATSGMVYIWHSVMDTEFRRQIIGGLTMETVERLEKRNGVMREQQSLDRGFHLNTEELKIELDEMIREAGVTPFLHTMYAAPCVEDNRVTAVFVENKSGRGAIRAQTVIDATGDGDLCVHLGVPFSSWQRKQPPTTCARFYGLQDLPKEALARLVLEHREEYGLPEGFAWGGTLHDMPELMFYAGTRVYDADCADAVSLTNAEIEGRRQIRAVMDIVRKYGGPEAKVALAGLAATIGIRETRHLHCRYRLTEEDVLHGRRFDDAIANCSYRVDIHHDDKPGITFRYLDGTEVYNRYGYPKAHGRWRAETPENPTFYQIPYRALVPVGDITNLLVCGRAIDADRGAFGGIRVMVNTNQTGEAAGVAAYLAARDTVAIGDVSPAALRQELAAGGAIVI